MLQTYVALQMLAQSVGQRLSREETGATAVEYGLMVALIAAVIVGVVLTLGGQVKSAFSTVSDSIADAT